MDILRPIWFATTLCSTEYRCDEMEQEIKKVSCYIVPLGHKLRNPKLEVFYWKDQNFDFKKLNKVECTTFKIIISI
jgi:hypothetical protein